MERLFLIELQSRPDGIVNQLINSYSTPAATLSMFHQRCAVACTSTQFTTVTLIVTDRFGNIQKNENIVTAYVPPQPEPQPEPDTTEEEGA